MRLFSCNPFRYKLSARHVPVTPELNAHYIAAHNSACEYAYSIHAGYGVLNRDAYLSSYEYGLRAYLKSHTCPIS